MAKKSVASQVKRNEQMNARRGLLEELFNDLYKDRGNIYLVNFVRGLFFGLGVGLVAGLGTSLGAGLVFGLGILMKFIFSPKTKSRTA